ncbi:MAG: type II CAAX endopeptidase family protein [Jaaginema sp. PMC 1079.18]|nr:type II CAAX endopeptidase family protein [Jaaginema sp. PMC 1080.18]MEC4851568.1 type II CAAX endopeptidase family protein [Jaaginema sp. PMC 1079.18]
MVFLWLPLALPLWLIFQDDPNATTIATMGALFVLFLILVHLWGRWVYREPNLLRRYGWRWTKRHGIDLLQGLSLGIMLPFALFALMGALGWVTWHGGTNVPRIVLEGLLSGLGVGMAEELVFRGWLHDELKRDYAPKTTLWVNALSFAILHFLKPLEEIVRTFPQFPGLVLLGLALVWAKRSRRGRLGVCIGLHGGLVWGYYILNVGQIIEIGDRVSPWITGVDGNPVAGCMGLLFLSFLVLAYRYQARSQRRPFQN